jgi:hypothetical protein
MWVARHPSLVLGTSIAVVLFFCIILLRLELETRPESCEITLEARLQREGVI